MISARRNAVGYMSLVDCPKLTWSFGLTYWYSPFLCPSLSSAMFAITSLAFMLVEVPAPPWMKSVTNWSRISPAISRSQASAIASATLASSTPRSRLASAAAFLA